jgi:alginate O-acetyltransferase complex protein AlgI
MLGFQLPQNFNSPYKACSITEFWRRWHISLSSWLRDYLYIPLGGNRRGELRTYANLCVTMLLGGLWHGAAWSFVFWGDFHGFLLALERAIGKRSLFWWAPRPVQQAGTFLLVLIAWVFFRAPSFDQALAVLRGMVGLNEARWVEPGWWWADQRLALVMLALCAVIAWGTPNTWEIRWRPGLLLALALVILFTVCVGVILVNTSSPFLYFQF